MTHRELAEAVASGVITTPLDGFVRLTDEEWRRMVADVEGPPVFGPHSEGDISGECQRNRVMLGAQLPRCRPRSLARTSTA